MNRKQRRAQNRGRGAGGNKTVADAAFAAAVSHHRAERLVEALQAYGQVSPYSPAYTDAMRFGGQVALRLGNPDGAAGMLARAVERKPDDARLHYNLGVALKECGRLQESIDPFRRAMDLDVTDAEAPANLGSALAALGDHPAALAAFEAALKRRPDHPAVLSNMGLTLRAMDRRDEAMTVLRRAHAIAPDHRDTAINIGSLLLEQNKTDAAISAFEDALTDGQEDPLALANLGATLLAAERIDDAVAAFRRLVAATPGDAAAHYALGGSLYDQGDIAAATAAFQQAVRLRPAFGEAWDNLGIALQAAGALGEAIRAHRRAAEYLPDEADCLFNLGTALHAAERDEDARLTYRRCLERDPAHAGARHMLTALTDGMAETAPEGYVANLFDSYARWFEDHLVHGLGYHTPDLMRRIFDRLAQEGAVPTGPFARGLDLGCGTGLVGAAFRDRARHLTGVDLSRRMVAESRRKDIYDDLAAGEMVAFLNGPQAQDGFGFIVAADVLVYIGNLAPLFHAAAGVMDKGAPFLFSIEKLDDGDYSLGPAGRFAHSAGYIQRVAVEAGFTVAASEEIELRRDRDQPVIGLLCVLVRDGV